MKGYSVNMKKDVKLYNMIFPPFILITFTPWFFVFSLVGNFLIDSAVLTVIMLVVFKKFDRSFYIRKIFILWGLGFGADFIGCFYILYANRFFDDNIWMIIIGIIISSACIFALDFVSAFLPCKTMTLRQKLLSALAFAVLTAPYTFLMRSTVFM